MRFAVLISGLVLGAMNLAAQQAYFPPLSFGATGRVDRLFSEYVAHELQLLGENSFLPRAGNKSIESYRFIWLRAFDPPVSVRLDVQPDGSGVLTTKIGPGEAAFPASQHGNVQAITNTLSREEVERFRALVTQEHFWTTPPYAFHDQQGTDGAAWIIEATVAGTYHVTERWSPTNSIGSGKDIVRQLGIAMAFNLAKLSIPKEKIY